MPDVTHRPTDLVLRDPVKEHESGIGGTGAAVSDPPRRPGLDRDAEVAQTLADLDDALARGDLQNARVLLAQLEAKGVASERLANARAALASADSRPPVEEPRIAPAAPVPHGQRPAAKKADAVERPTPLVDDAMRTVISEDEWNKRVASLTSLQLRQLAATSLIRRQGRVLDVGAELSDEGESAYVVVCALGSDQVIGRFTLPAEDMTELMRWSRWDRVAWNTRPTVNEFGTVSYMPLVQRARDLARTRNSDFAPGRPAPREGDGAAYMLWLKRYSTYCSAQDWSRAWREYRSATQRTWLLRGEVSQVEAGSAAVVFGGFTRIAEARNHRPTGREWGIRVEPHWLEIDDPQVAQTIRPGALVEVEVRLVDVASPGELAARDGRFEVALKTRRFVSSAPSVR